MSEMSGMEGFPKVYSSGVNKKNQPYIVQEKLGKSLKDIFYEIEDHFTKICILNLAIKLVEILERLHEKGYIHCDIKPDNILIGNEDKDPDLNRKIYLIDFGLA